MVRQKMIAPHFQPASTERNQMMFREASVYYQHFKTVIKRLVRVMKDYEELTQSIHSLLECRAPRLYTMETDGSVGAELRDGDAYLGTGIQIGRLTTSARTLHTRMSEEVISTIQQWFKNYERCRVLLNELGVLKYEVDSRHRTVVTLGNQKTIHETKIQEGDSSKEFNPASQLESASMKLKHKESKFDLCQSEFQHKEEELNQAMRALLSEVRILAELIGHVFQILSDVPNDAHRAFKEGTASGVQPPLHITHHVDRNSVKSEPEYTLDPSNPFA